MVSHHFMSTEDFMLSLHSMLTEDSILSFLSEFSFQELSNYEFCSIKLELL